MRLLIEVTRDKPVVTDASTPIFPVPITQFFPTIKPFPISWDWVCGGGCALVAGLILHPAANNYLEKTLPAQLLQKLVATKVKSSSTSSVNGITFPLKGGTPGNVAITGNVGDCRDNCRRRHAGVDYAYTGQIVSALNGVVSELKPNSPVGGVIGIDSLHRSKGNVRIRYVHLNRDSVRGFRIGQRIRAGQTIGFVRETFPGSSGPHPHIEVYFNGQLSWQPQDFLEGRL